MLIDVIINNEFCGTWEELSRVEGFPAGNLSHADEPCPGQWFLTELPAGMTVLCPCQHVGVAGAPGGMYAYPFKRFNDFLTFAFHCWHLTMCCTEKSGVPPKGGSLAVLAHG